MLEAAFDTDSFCAPIDFNAISIAAGQQLSGTLPQLNNEMLAAFVCHAKLILQVNRRFNLTAVTSLPEMALKHYLDSLTCCLAIDFTAVDSVCDVGSGAGFPGIPLAICFPGTQFVLLEANQKKAGFLTECVAELELPNCQVITDRAENYGQGGGREKFSVVVSRAVAPMPVLAEYCLPLTRVGGTFLAMRGKEGASEANLYKQAFSLLGAGDTKVTTFVLDDAGERSLITIQKVGITPAKYPRRPGMPEKKPLI
jgi:16S rRNA (guanine527-N7)-methyltransferase